MGRMLALAILAICAPLSAQIVSSAGGADMSRYPTRAEMVAALAAVPAPGASVPSTETIGGSAGQSAAYMRADARLPRITRAGVATTDVNGGWSITWSTPLPAAPATLPIPMIPAGGTEPIVCLPSTSSATGASGRCWYARTLPAAVTLLSQIAGYDVFGAAASGITVQVFAIPTTQ